MTQCVILSCINFMKLIPSAHFKRRLLERGVTWKDCEKTVASPDRKSSQYKGMNGGVVHKYEKDFADRTIVVVIGEKLPKSNNVLAITAWKADKQ